MLFWKVRKKLCEVCDGVSTVSPVSKLIFKISTLKTRHVPVETDEDWQLLLSSTFLYCFSSPFIAFSHLVATLSATRKRQIKPAGKRLLIEISIGNPITIDDPFARLRGPGRGRGQDRNSDYRNLRYRPVFR